MLLKLMSLYALCVWFAASAANAETPKQVALVFNATFDMPSDHWVKIPLIEGPGVLRAHFQNPVDPDDMDPEIPQIICDFKVNLTKAQVDKVRALVKKIKICVKPEEDTHDYPSDGVHYTYANGRKKWFARKYDESETRYACAGASALYAYVEKLVVPRAPRSCPQQYREELFGWE